MGIFQCRWVGRRLAIFAESRDSADFRGEDIRRVERHLIGCPSCRAKSESLNEVVRLLHAVAVVPAIASDSISVWPALSRQIRSSRHRRHGVFVSMRRGPMMGLAASFLGLGTMIGIVSWNLGSASATRVHQARHEFVAPRSALPPVDVQVGVSPATNKPDSSRILEVDTKSTNLTDPQRSQ